MLWLYFHPFIVIGHRSLACQTYCSCSHHVAEVLCPHDKVKYSFLVLLIYWEEEVKLETTTALSLSTSLLHCICWWKHLATGRTVVVTGSPFPKVSNWSTLISRSTLLSPLVFQSNVFSHQGNSTNKGYWFNIYPGEWHPLFTGCYFQMHFLRGYSNALWHWQFLGGVVCGRRDGSKDYAHCFLFGHKVGPWSEVLLSRISCFLNPQIVVIAEMLWARKANPCHKQLSKLNLKCYPSPGEVISWYPRLARRDDITLEGSVWA